MLKFIGTILLMIWFFGSTAMALNIEQYHNQDALAEQAASIVIAEALASENQNKTLVMIVPTGSTAIPLYKKIVEKWKQGAIDLSKIIFFNMDEYAGLSKENPNSYHSFMHQHFYQFVLNKPNGVPEHHANIPNFTGSKDQIQASVEKYANEIAKYQTSNDYRVVLFGGIGRGPAHIAFNDFTEEFKDTAEKDREGLARQLGTRLVPLDDRTRHANKRFFDQDIDRVPKYAISIGFKEILASDRIVIMANDASKREAIESVLRSKPSYKVPASLLKLVEHKVSIMVSKDCFDQQGPQHKLSSSEARIWVPSLYKNTGNSFKKFSVQPEAKAIVIQETNSWPNEAVFKGFLPINSKFLSLDDEGIMQQVQSIGPDLVVMPHNSKKLGKLSSLRRSLHEYFITKGRQPKIIQYETEHGMISGVNLIIGLTQAELEKQKEALLHHKSQVNRTEFQHIAYENNKDFQSAMEAEKRPLPENSIGVEAYKVYKLKNGQLTYQHKRPDPSSLPWGKRDEIMIASPHPDDAEIGCGGLIQRLGKLQNPPHVLNASSGARSPIFLSDVLDHPNPNQELIKKAKLNLNAEGLITDLIIKRDIRAYESNQALNYLAPGIKLQNLDLEFYMQRSEPSDNDHKRVAFELAKGLGNSVHKDGQFVLLVPNPIDSHQTHRTVSKLFIEEAKKLSQRFPDMEIDLAYYKTPWTGRYNLFLYTDNPRASAAKAMIGAERASHLGSSGNDVLNQTDLVKAKKALAFILSDRI